MNQSMQSMFRFYSIGIVFRDKARNTKTIRVFPTEYHSAFSGSLDDDETIVNVNYSNELEDVVPQSIKIEQTFEATWLPMSNGNRRQAPDVCNGERVMIYKMGDINTFFWDTIFDDHELRKNEQYIISCSNTPKTNTPLDDTNTYWQGMDAQDKLVTIFHTANNDKELTTHSMQLNTKTGVWEYKDGRGNMVSLKSGEDGLEIVTKASVKIKTKKLSFECDEFSLDCKNASWKANNSIFKTKFQVNGASSFLPPISTAFTAAKT